ncbi:DnaJ domain-containing protein [Pisolithus orientalis]|uniref:DnaJ domain-containing protein n=1 Tax=Pisolithus orientalis TaxID=936130 RepID=UPI002223FF6A|nr:DnaJ domain-containing protein [Pisolithus orientalis]KAI6025968.1 DnaJ domain-containing protein [Pisolithus orientalis]
MSTSQSSSKPASPPSQSRGSTSAASSSTPVDADLEQLLSREASAFQREMEVERILKSFKLNPYDILNLDFTAKPEDIKRKYRQLSLFIHPDKTAHPRAPDAFDILKKAEAELSDAAKREELDAAIASARTTLLRSLSLPTNLADDDPRLRNLGDDPKLKEQGLTTPWKIMLKEKIKEVLIEEEVRRRKAIKLNLANEGLEARKKEEEVASRKRKAEEDKVWEETREQRVDSWRSFTNNTKKKKKQKVAILG